MTPRAFISNLRKAIARRISPQNFYEAGRRWDSQRTFLTGYVQDPRADMDTFTRSEIVRKSRWFEQNDAVAQGIAQKYVEFTVGAYGPQITPASKDEEWNQRATDWLNEWYSLADLITRFGYGGLMTTAAWRTFFDGEFFILKTKGESGNPRLQGISSHRVGTPPEKMDQEGASIIDGVAIEPNGRPKGYWIQEGINADEYTFRTANEIIHIFEPESPGQYRGLPMLTCVLNDLHDLNDLRLGEMGAAKEAAFTSNVFTTETGEIKSPGLVREAFGITDQTSNGTSIDEDRMKAIRRVLGSRSIALKTGESVAQLRSERPSVTTQWFWDDLVSRICCGIGFPRIVLLAQSIQGTVARGEYEMARSYFFSRFAPYVSAIQQIYFFTIGTARFTDIRIADAPADWTKCQISPPRIVDVDPGRNASATVALLEAGMTTRQREYAKLQLDWRSETRQLAREAAFIDEVAAEFGIAPDRLQKSIAESLQANMDLEDQRQKEDELVEA